MDHIVEKLKKRSRLQNQMSLLKKQKSDLYMEAKRIEFATDVLIFRYMEEVENGTSTDKKNKEYKKRRDELDRDSDKISEIIGSISGNINSILSVLESRYKVSGTEREEVASLHKDTVAEYCDVEIAVIAAPQDRLAFSRREHLVEKLEQLREIDDSLLAGLAADKIREYEKATIKAYKAYRELISINDTLVSRGMDAICSHEVRDYTAPAFVGQLSNDQGYFIDSSEFTTGEASQELMELIEEEEDEG